MTIATSHVPANWRGQIVTWDNLDLPVSEEGRRVEPGNWSAFPHYFGYVGAQYLVAKMTEEHTVQVAVNLTGDLLGEPHWNTFGWTVWSNRTGMILHSGVKEKLVKAMKAAENAANQ